MTRLVLLLTGVIGLVALWGGPLPAATAERFSAHMLLHMGVISVAAPALALAVAGSRFDPVCHWPGVFNVFAATVVEMVIVWGWHAPYFHLAARQHMEVFGVEQVSFLVAGLWLWLAATGGERVKEPHRAWSGVAALLFTSMHMTLLGALFALAPRAVFGDGTPAALADLHLGGGLMLLIGGASYLAGGLGLSLVGLRHRARHGRFA
jgi:putative membrane protein